METRHHNYSKFSVRIDCNIFIPPSPPKKEKIFRFNSDFLLLTFFFFFNWSTKWLLLIRIISCHFVCLFYTACVLMIFIAGLWHLIITVSSLLVEYEAKSRFCWPVSVAIITDSLKACRWFRSFARNLPMRVCNYDWVENRAIRRKRPWARKVGSRTSCKKRGNTQGTKQPLEYFRVNSYTTRLYLWNETWIQNWELA